MATSHPLRIQIASYNFNLQGTTTPFPDLQRWLIPTLSETRPEYSSTSLTSGREAPDIYAVGFQELLPLHHAFADDQEAKEVRQHTAREIRRAVRHHAAVTRQDGVYPEGGGPEDYTLLAEVHLVSITLFVFGRNRSGVPQRLKEARVASASTGILNLLGNKGAVGVRLVLSAQGEGEDEVITLVCAHLAAHDHQVERRNADFKNIVSRLAFTPQSTLPLPDPPIAAPQTGEDMEKVKERYQQDVDSQRAIGTQKPSKPLDNQTYTLYDSHHAFFFGDLNYRLGLEGGKKNKEGKEGASSSAAGLSKHDVRRKVSQQDYATLAKHDQLARERQAGKTLQGFVEVDVGTAFGPTYKFKPQRREGKGKGKEGTGEGDAVKREKGDAPVKGQELSAKRVPGWTDRVLWASNGGQEQGEKTTGTTGAGSASVIPGRHGVHVELFRSIMGYTLSDHKPVTLLATLPRARQSNSNLAPYRLDGNYAAYRALGTLLDRLVGYAWCALVAAGAGQVLVGVAEVVVIALLSVWWLRTGGQQGGGGDLGYWFSSLAGRP
ncbi:DNase I-like protein [Jaminaea rosea]|uniref:DNase I-like protein n=1 Tax=Jaminaea rosea TaxID=1569628 RepID=A0A316UV54_9BASI|nr:DNase I-like protein [Jaminaea rosea]PWN28211.1 DNase I-like protein [Jaminaea rosea]